MKPVKPILFFTKLLLCWLFAAAFSSDINAQCTSGLKTVTYNVVLNGTGNNSWGFVFPQFDPSQGTLVAVDIKSIVSVNVNFQLQNNGAAQDNYAVQVGRDDDISVSALISPISNYYSLPYNTYTLQAGQDTVGAGTVASPEFFPLLSAYTINDSITGGVANFLGTGYVTFNYNPTTYVSVSSGTSYNLSTSASDTMKISMVYYYCSTNILPVGILNFSVAKEPDATALLQWQTENETEPNGYTIEESNDGKDFDSVAFSPSNLNIDSNTNYQYNYPIPSGTNGIMYFRLKYTNANGYTNYSEIKSIRLENVQPISLYPNPASDFINIVFNESSAAGWDVSIFEADGKLMRKKENIMGSSFQLTMLGKFARGTYFLRVINKDNQKLITLPLVLH